MKHGRNDYNRIQDPEGKIGENEPVFLLRAKDRTAPDAVRHWALLQYRNGGDRATANAAMEQANAMEDWQRENGAKSPDLPPT